MTNDLRAMTVTDAQLASLAGVSARRIRQLTEQGTLKRLGPNQFNLGEAFQGLLEDAAGTGSELQKQRTRKVRADADKAELDLARERGLVAPIADMQRLWEKQCALIRTGMLDIPYRVMPRIVGETSERVIKAALKEEIALALKAAAEYSPQDEPESEE